MRRWVSGLFLLIVASTRLASAQRPELSIGAATPAAELGAAVTMQDPETSTAGHNASSIAALRVRQGVRRRRLVAVDRVQFHGKIRPRE